MATMEFVSFDHDHQRQLGGFKLLKNHPNHPLDFQSYSSRMPCEVAADGPSYLRPRTQGRSGCETRYLPSATVPPNWLF